MSLVYLGLFGRLSNQNRLPHFYGMSQNSFILPCHSKAGFNLDAEESVVRVWGIFAIMKFLIFLLLRKNSVRCLSLSRFQQSFLHGLVCKVNAVLHLHLNVLLTFSFLAILLSYVQLSTYCWPLLPVVSFEVGAMCKSDVSQVLILCLNLSLEGCFVPECLYALP